jgi:hypothetical protein
MLEVPQSVPNLTETSTALCELLSPAGNFSRRFATAQEPTLHRYFALAAIGETIVYAN